MGPLAILSALRGWKLGGAIGVLVLIVGLVFLVKDRARLQVAESRAQACEAAVKAGEPTTQSCPQAISDAATRGLRYSQCDVALQKGDLYGVRAACSAAVKRRDAEASAFAATAADAAAQLAAARGQVAAAVARADARAETLQRRKKDADAAIASAPRAGDGRIRCDDHCLRDLAD